MPSVTVALTSSQNTYYKKVGQYPKYNKPTESWVVSPDETINETNTRCWIGTDVHESDNSYWHLKAELTFEDPGLPANAVITGAVLHIRVDGYGSSTNPRDVLVVAAPESDSLAEPGETGHTVLGSFSVNPGMIGTWASVNLSTFQQVMVLLGAGANEDGRYCRLNLAEPHVPYVEVFYELLEPWSFELYGSLAVGESGTSQIQAQLPFVVYGSLRVSEVQTSPPVVESVSFQAYGSLRVTQAPDVLVEGDFEVPFKLSVSEFVVDNNKYVTEDLYHWVELSLGEDDVGQFGFKVYGSLRLIGSGDEPPPGQDTHATLTVQLAVTGLADVWIDRNSLNIGRCTLDQGSSWSSSLSTTLNLNSQWLQDSVMECSGMELEGAGKIAASATLRATLELVGDG